MKKDELPPVEQIRAAWEEFVVALKVSSMIRTGKWHADQLPTHMQFHGEPDPLWTVIHHRRITQDQFLAWASDIVYSTGLLVITAVDEALARKFGVGRVDDENLQRKNARCIVYVIRCAGAHNPVRPRWQFNPPYRKVWELPALGISLDGAALDGKLLLASHFGGWMKFKMLVEHSMRLIDPLAAPLEPPDTPRSDSSFEPPPRPATGA